MRWLVLFLAVSGCAHVSARGEGALPLNEGISKVSVRLPAGDITVTGTSGPFRATWRVHAEAHSDERARELARRVMREPPIEQRGGSIVIGDLERYGLGFSESVSIDIELEVPFDIEVELDSAAGDMRVAHVRGPVRCSTAAGDVTVSHVGGDVEIDTAAGDIRLAARPSPGARWKIDTAAGDIHLGVPADAAFRFHACTAAGDIRSELPLTLAGEISSSNVEATIGNEPTASVEVSTSAGDIRVERDMALRSGGRAAASPPR